MDLLKQYTDTQHPDRQHGAGQRRAGRGHRRQPADRASAVGGGRGALDAQPTASAPRLYVESLNETFDAQSSRIYGLDNRVPTAVGVLGPVGAAIARGLLALPLAALGRGLTIVLVAAVLVTLTLIVTLNLYRPVRGLIRVSATPLVDVRASMVASPASAGS